jgi:hypothetical protein
MDVAAYSCINVAVHVSYKKTTCVYLRAEVKLLPTNIVILQNTVLQWLMLNS